ncbi:unnamed protein product [Dracunculus medinensis]|uniref:Secreted protein n=1 Tax=Dracunculus medinensis TaxID=318479 RepID=A0A0N4U4J1_DRAME|nr:unnamed protein product [Dracunculus medinensis]
MLHAYLLLLLLANAKPFLLPSGNRCNCPQTPACPSVAECPSVPPPCPVNPPCFARGEKTYHPNDGAASAMRFINDVNTAENFDGDFEMDRDLAKLSQDNELNNLDEDDSDLLAAKYGRTYRLVKRSSETTSPESVLPTASDITNSNSKINQNTKCNSPLLKQIMLEVNVFTYC